ncbi:succinate dehydrogenase/fumarate reductase flavoprotein subunit [Natronocella acetinitrilica]|uniref:Succinate dehydrogenase/fumarate reductase flavoprotein subunit n=1 Tax=Natronocella acetinitrilica TaxID=414046 RepID=A0AAE3KCQ7_9GAMM|nr:FAD-dependent oxidoreductase [Natronocella acetinitrilica]MCP1677240.1 succinate dehydrogenase/fumarate reductase flavoprotein subunit [Natronocella acetinitrilica]
MSNKQRWSEQPDVLVVGSGAAGLTAAIVAHDRGARVLVVERTDKVGGTTAVSGGGIWIPLNHHMVDAGYEDSREEALAYCKALAMGRVDEELIETFIDTAPDVIRYIEENTLLKFNAMTAPDYHPELTGGKQGGRSIEAEPFDTRLLGEWQSRLRPPNAFAFPITRQEAFGDYDAFYRPWLVPQDLAVERMTNGVVTLGQALAAGLLKAVLDRGIEIRLETRVRVLIVQDDEVVGVRAENDAGSVYIKATSGVVLASAGFEWNKELTDKFIGGEIENPNSPPFNDGDGLLMAMEVGADLANMNEVWNFPSLMIPGESYEGQPLSRAVNAERSGPHVIWVNRHGKRFVNEAANYNSMGKVFQNIETDRPDYENLPAWAIIDSQYREKYVLGTTMPEDPDPPWAIRSESLQELAHQTGIDGAALEATVERWNALVRDGRDADFGKGESLYDRFQGDREADNPNMGTIEKPPFYAIPVHTGALGTKGGPRTNSSAQVLNVRGHPIVGLYAAGNVTASITGPGYYGRGATLGPALTWGYLAGAHAADQREAAGLSTAGRG